MPALDLKPPRRASRDRAPTPFAEAVPLPRARRRGADLPRGRVLAAVAVLTAVAAAVRLAIPRGLWLDEAISVHQANLSLGAMLDEIQFTDRHPPLHHLVLWATVRLFGDGELAVRLPALVAGVALVPVLYALASELYDRRCGLAAATLATVAPLLVWYAQEARMYAFVAFFAALSAWGQARAVRRGGAVDWSIFAVGATGLIWSHYGGLAILAAQQLLFVVAAVARRADRRALRPYLLGWGLTTALLAWQAVPLLAFAADQFRSSGAAETFGTTQFNVGSGGDGLSLYGVLTNLGWALFGYQRDVVSELAAATWPLFLIAGVVLLGRGLGRATLGVAALAVLPVAAFLVAGLANRDLFEVRYFVGCVPFALVLVARLTTSWPSRDPGRIAATGFVAIVLAATLVVQQRDPENPRRYDYREAFALVREEARPGDVLVLEPRDLRYVAEYYAPAGLRRVALTAGVPTRREARRVLLLASFQNDPRFRRRVEAGIRVLRDERRLVRAERNTQADLYVFR